MGPASRDALASNGKEILRPQITSHPCELCKIAWKRSQASLIVTVINLMLRERAVLLYTTAG